MNRKSGWAELDLQAARNLLHHGHFSRLSPAQREREVLRLLTDTVVRPRGARPSVESMATGLTNVITDYTTSREIVKNTGYLIPVFEYEYGASGSDRALVDVEAMAAAFKELHDNGAKRKSLGKKALKRGISYDWKRNCIKKWDEFIEREDYAR